MAMMARCALTLALLLSGTSWADTYYVDQSHPAASNLNPGTEDEPWLTIQHAAETLQSGDTVYVKAGVYAEQVVPLNTGTLGGSIIYAAYPGHEAIIDGSTVALDEHEALFQIEGLWNIRVTGFRIVGARARDTNYGIAISNAGSIDIDHNVVSNTSSSGIIVWGSNGITIEYNEIELACNAGAASENECLSVGETGAFMIRYNHVHDGNPVRGEGIDAKDGSSGGRIYGNLVERVQSVGIYIDAWDKPTSNMWVFNNLVRDVDGDGISVGSEQGGVLSDVRIFNNVVTGSRWIGISVHSCCTSSHPVNGLEIINNTSYGNGTSGWGGGILDENDQATGVVIRNNLCAGNHSFEIALEGGVTPGDITSDHNLIEAWHGYLGETCGGYCVVGDPLLVDPDSGDLHLQPLSPAIDAGSPAGAPAYDIDGVLRPQGTGFDIGAYEHPQDPVFADDFESGDTLRWSLTHP